MTVTAAPASRWRVMVDRGERVRLAGDAKGSGRLPVALLHGLGGTRRGWDAVAGRLAATRRVLWWDHRGHGDSDAPAVRYGITRLVDDTGIVLQAVAGGP